MAKSYNKRRPIVNRKACAQPQGLYANQYIICVEKILISYIDLSSSLVGALKFNLN
jgi:hypothetical protein